MFTKILIANRGEIACRIARTAKKMGIKSVAVHSAVDGGALHVGLCDEAVPLGGNKPGQSYLDIKKTIAAAKSTDAEAIHPGYGFLSENAKFARACKKNNIAFIGPSARSIQIMGAKNIARKTAAKAGIPVLPGYDGRDQSPALLKQKADRIGYPLLIKAVSGGGGKGMRIVNSAEKFDSALKAVQRESLGAFADDSVLLEKYLPRTRHIEVQIFADSHGNVVHLYERDCSMQRRHQKVIEESPAPKITETKRKEMTDAAVECARSIHYLGAGTVEFLYAPDGSFYFMEMNTRLQVEHPVTEMVTGVDLVEWQIRVAAGEALPREQSEINLHGHAIEARIYAENPGNQFLPSTGEIKFIRPPKSAYHCRADTGVKSGDVISPFYDPMIAKLIARHTNRSRAINQLRLDLGRFIIFGVKQNLAFMRALITQKQFKNAELDTRFIERHLDDLTHQPETADAVFRYAAIYLYFLSVDTQRQQQLKKEDRWSPWTGGGDTACTPPQRFYFQFGDELKAVSFKVKEKLFYFGGKSPPVGASLSDNNLRIRADGNNMDIIVLKSNSKIFLHCNENHYELVHIDPRIRDRSNETPAGALNSPMPGSVIAVTVQANQPVARGDPLMVIEAMKMEHQVRSPMDGKVTAVHYKQGDQVDEGASLLTIERDEQG